MSKTYLLIIIFTCVCALSRAQVNFVKNPGFENYSKCPDEWNQILYAKNWSAAIDTIGTEKYYVPDYLNSCAGANLYTGIPFNNYFYQNTQSGNGMAAGHFYYDKSLPYPGPLVNYRDYIQGRLIKPLNSGKMYCISFWVNLGEISGYAQDKIGMYIDNGGINTAVDTPGKEIFSVIPQLYSTLILDDTSAWTKIEGTFVSTGLETHITIGNFFENSKVNTVVMSSGTATQYSYYLIDDVSVIPIDLVADAGKESHAEPGKTVQIGRVGDTTAQGLDCKWYHKGVLIDSGAIISVNGSAIVGTVDTYVVVQTICGLVKTDTVTVTTVPVGIKEWDANKSFTVYPNPSNGVFTITQPPLRGTKQSIKVYDLIGRVVCQQAITFSNNTTNLKVDAGSGVYILQLTDEEGNSSRQRIIIE